ncbi:MAG: tetraacyldisaccharide 4'-kinase, partial [Actinobacteria bacterium]|nr:tetraacyldisaccharide 4'-kinase [Actinomycetota bacterium]
MAAAARGAGGLAMSGPLPAWLAPVAWPASLAYGFGLRLREAALARGAAWQAPRAVISVGNVSAGGTGKSPMVRWLCAELRAMGRSPAVVMRGHRGGERSDEALEHRMEMPEVPVAVGADRRAAIDRLLANDPKVDALVLDDGFQHRRVARDLDLVLVDAMRPAIDGALLPLGWLREPASGLRRADAVVVTRAHGVDAALAARIERLHGRPPLAWSHHAWRGVRVRSGLHEARCGLEWFRGRRVAVWAGIGNRAAFVAQVREAGAQVVDEPHLADHEGYAPGTLSRLVERCRRLDASDVVCTGKDWAKLEALDCPHGLRFAWPELHLAIDAGEGALRTLLA